MKKIHISLILVTVLVLCALLFSSCQNNTLNKPSGLNLDVATQTLRWNMVKGASFYSIEISGGEKTLTTKNNFVSLEYLKPGDYEIKVQAVSGNEVYKNSAYAVFQFTREVESGLKYKLINNDTEFELIGGGTATGEVVMESVYRGKPVTSIADKALYTNNRITKITIGSNVKKIGEKAFAKCTKLETIVIPENVKSIGANAFDGCKSLVSVKLPNSITVIPAHLFDWCSALQTVTIGKNVQSIGEYAFANCEAMTSITFEGADHTTYACVLPDTLKTIGDSAFMECYAMTTLALGKYTEKVGTKAFEKCDALTQVYLGESLTALETKAFYSCDSLNGVRIPDSVTKIGDSVFLDCAALDDITFGNGLKSVGVSVLLNTKIFNEASTSDMLIINGWLIQYFNATKENLTINEGVQGIASYAFAGNPALVQVSLKGVKYVGYAAFYQMPKLYKVTFDNALYEIGDYAFSQCIYLDKVSLGESLTTMGSYAFYGCTTLAEITLPESLTTIGSRAFRSTAAYTKLEKSSSKGVLYMGGWAVDFIAPNSSTAGSAILKEGTRGIANYTFNAQTLTQAILPNGLLYIGRGAFYNCGTMNRVSLPSTLKYIGDYAFYGCGYVNFGGNYFDLVIPPNTEYIGRSAFYKCENILSIEVPGTVKTIGPYAFYGCKAVGLTVPFKQDSGEKDENGNPIIIEVPVTGYIKLGEGIESIGERAFQGCASLRQIIIPDSVTYLGKRAFYKCEKLHTVTLGSGITEINEYLFYKCTDLANVTISDELKSIGNYAFRGCTALTSFDFREVESIGRYSFYGCSALTNIVLPETVESIGDYAFRGCTSATAIVVSAEINEIGKHVFYGLKGTTLYCEAEGIKPYWNSQFNSSYRPVFWGVTLSADNSYVVSAVAGEDAIENPKATGGISDPIREGYIFAGWATEANSDTVVYTSQNVNEAPTGTVLYAVWMPEA